MPTLRRTLLACLCLGALGTPPLLHAQAAVKVEGAWARPTVPGQAAGGGYLKITGGAAADKLVSARADGVQRVEFHSMTMEGDVMRMREVVAIEVPAGRAVELKPGGLHLMFVGVAKALKAGDRLPLTLRFEKAGEVKVEMQVMTQAAMPHTPAAAGGHKH